MMCLHYIYLHIMVYMYITCSNKLPERYLLIIKDDINHEHCPTTYVKPKSLQQPLLFRL